MKWEITKAHIILDDEVLNDAGIVINGNKIDSILKSTPDKENVLQVNLDGMFVFPGLIDAHDHLLGTYLPKVGDNKPYLNWLPWDNDLKASPIYAERQRLDAKQLYYLGAYRHLINGVTSVHDHIPHFVQANFVDLLPIRVLTNFTIAHSINSFSLPWGREVEEEYEEAVEKNIPFVTHCSEGFDAETKAALGVLHRRRVLGPHTVLIHGIAFSDEDIEIIAKTQTNVVWCPNSNLYMFNETTNIRGLLEAGVNVCLGTDSPMSGSVNMFEEFRTAKEFYREKYGEDIPDEVLYKMVSTNPASAFKVDDSLGDIAPGKNADFLILDGRYKNPYRSLIQGDLNDVRLVVIDGQPRYGDESMEPLFKELKVPIYPVTIDGERKIACQNIEKLFRSIQKAVGFEKKLDFLPII
jgi:cytosine/adenosine deaminase-related metal-dependent hydrolase